MANKAIADILTDFELRRMRRERQYQERRAEDGEIQELEQEKRALLQKKLERAFLAGGENAAEDARIGEIEAQQRAIEQKKGIAPAYACPICRDRGTANGRYCVCLLREIYCKVFGAVDPGGLRVDFTTFDLGVFDDEKILKNQKTQRQTMALYRDVCAQYVGDFPHTKCRDILLCGKVGGGKTYLLDCMAAEAQKRGIDVCLIRAVSLFNAFFAHRMGEEIPLGFLHNADLLLLDDLGTEPVTQNVSAEYLFDLLNRRMEAGKHTVVATNVDDLQKRYDDRIFSRLRAGLVLRFDGDDLRLR